MKIVLALAAATGAAAFTAPRTAFTARASTALDANIVDTLAGLEGPGQVWGADGIAVGKEESDLKGYDGFGLFCQRLAETGVGANLASPGPYTVFAPTDTAVQAYEIMNGPLTADAIAYMVISGAVSSSAISSADLTTVNGKTLTYSRKFRKDFVNDAIIGEKTFGPFADFPTDVACDNGVIHSVGILLSE
uniref:FAS1 domain-containing protein n=1 Tax=Trieres chinensis TaxID=1514140 RepID=A0A7S2EJ04_TRICV|mmetsp:Transcript_26162/g.53582  ORF Transcript_26162/g.53582 Transcript_26162/m.53582 type:complete len:191 (+) Transcript_26162:106-678(+)|eukprot:CAMPEP_0183292606 /NCGR_PEP_ID=MMETSP0160_2-20130417/1599_1 /TAXON_ID=2839 ORGANISM="Odontella Sinensis, Strain Grunow 1884" /NCGR_SAMPLE_ID=MMETSP0160_2 /ASSEMBLY_ACC=CAM_ASM_000250 /LENGTH=190 /DNA_ID=CAMNT_0025453581 /DNA_START=46 /DNA_END=618 /DNA_ORIENTATION=-